MPTHSIQTCYSASESGNLYQQQSSMCGNGRVEDNQECDDGNNNEKDGCDKTCQVDFDFYCPKTGRQTQVCCRFAMQVMQNERYCQADCNNQKKTRLQQKICQQTCTDVQMSQLCLRQNLQNLKYRKTIMKKQKLDQEIKVNVYTTRRLQQEWNCKEGEVKDKILGMCVSVCADDEIWNTITKKCVKCVNGRTIDSTKYICKCFNRTVYNETITACQDLCPKGTTFDEKASICDDICQAGFFFNVSSLKCQTFLISSYQLDSFYKSPIQNSFFVSVNYNSSKTARLLLSDSPILFQANFPYQTISVQQQTSSYLLFKVSYNQSLNSFQNMTISINNAVINLPPVTDNNLALKYYSSEQYSAYQTFLSLIPILTYGVFFLLIITFLFSSKLIAIETFLVFQFTFGGLIMMKKIQAMMYPYKQLWLFDGFNIRIDDGIQVPPRISAINMHANFLSNFNINIVIYLLPSIVGYTLIIVHKILKRMRKKNQLQKYGGLALGQWQMSAMLICIQQLVFAFVINIKYSPEPILGIIVGVGLLLLYAFTAFNFYKEKMTLHQAMRTPFGDYKSFFNLNSLNFYVWVMLYRASLSLILVLMSDSIISQSLVLFWTTAYLIYLLVRHPYKKSAQLVPILNSCIMVILAIFFLYQRNKADEAEINFSTYMPIVVLVLLALTCIFNSIYAGFNFHHTRIHKKKIQAIHRQIQKAKEEQASIEFHSGTIQNVTSDGISQNISQNISNIIAQIRNQNEKDDRERPTTAIKDISPIPKPRHQPIIQSGQISELNEKIRTISQMMNEDSSYVDSNHQ